MQVMNIANNILKIIFKWKQKLLRSTYKIELEK